MTDSARKPYQLYCSITGQGERFNTAESAAAAWQSADARDRPCIIYSNGRSAQLLVRTLILGDRIVKSLPGDTEPQFHAAYVALMAKSLTP